MTARKVVPREPARQDMREAVEYYRSQQAPHAIRGFVQALNATYRYIERYPARGKLYFAHDLDLPGLRFRRLKTYPYRVFYLYVERAEEIDVWGVLHLQRDVASSLRHLS